MERVMSCLDSVANSKEVKMECQLRKSNNHVAKLSTGGVLPTRLSAIILGGSALALTAFIQPSLAGVLIPGDLVVSESTYQDVGAVAGLVAGTSQLPGATAGTTVAAVAGGNYLTVWNNAGVDGSFGVTSEITLQTLTQSGAVANTLNIPTNQV